MTMLKRSAALATVLGATLALSACESIPVDQRLQGQVLGGATGAVLGSAVGSGTGRVVATGAGAVLGTIVGGKIADRMD